MKRLLEIAKKQADAVTVFGASYTVDNVSFDNARLKSADSHLNSGTALTVVKNGRQGFAFTRNLIDREGLVRDAVAALAGGVEAAGELPQPVELPKLDTAAEQVGGNSVLVDECRRITDYLSSRVKGQVNVGAGRIVTDHNVLTSSGVDARCLTTACYAYAAVLYPGTSASISRSFQAKAFAPFPEQDLRFIADTYNASEKEVKAASGRIPVLFLPFSVWALAWRLQEATDARNVYEKVSPLVGRIGERILSEKLTIADKPLDDSLPGARAFDDEGTPCRDLMLFERGVLKGFYNDRFYARKTGTEPTGHGYRDDVTARPQASLNHLVISPGEHSFAEMLKLMGRGVVAVIPLGAHSGNRLHGDYSIGLAPGLWVEDGAVVGVVKDALVAGNVYEDLKNVIAVENRIHDSQGIMCPSLLLDNVSFTARA
jgi:PmbA protein